jgi:hypothetical protein
LRYLLQAAWYPENSSPLHGLSGSHFRVIAGQRLRTFLGFDSSSSIATAKVLLELPTGDPKSFLRGEGSRAPSYWRVTLHISESPNVTRLRTCMLGDPISYTYDTRLQLHG